ncbi:MAG TPA: flagellar biosynthetic protein FliO [Phycisphaerales bacterium]|nr:flagellar biosynthetic protein FliO [Phycisphaerales bacterium]
MACGQSIEDKPLGKPVAAAPSAQTSTTPTSLGSAALRTGGALAAVLVLVAGCALGFKQLAKKGVLPSTLVAGARAPSGLLEVLARYPMGGGQSLVVLKFDRRILLVCQSAGKALRRGGGAMNLIAELSEPEDVASVLLKVRGAEQAAMAEKFQRMLASEDDAAERTLAPARPVSGKTQPSPKRTHDKAPRSAPPAAAPASVLRSRLAVMREQQAPVRTPAAVPASASARPKEQRTEFVG